MPLPYQARRRRPLTITDNRRPNTINMPFTALQEMLDRFDSVEPVNQTARDFHRWPFRLETLRLDLFHPGGNSSTLAVACRNISRGGVGLLHNAFVHPNSECRVTLPHGPRGPASVPGRIIRCAHRTGVIHELGVKFDNPINPRDYIVTDLFAGHFTLERADPRELEGVVLHVEPSDVVRRVIAGHLAPTKLTVDSVGSITEAILSVGPCDVVLLSVDTPDDPRAAIDTLRQSGFSGPVIGTASNDSAETRRRLEGADLRAVVLKPITRELLWRALAEVLIVAPSTSAACTFEDGGAAALSLCGSELRRAADGADVNACRRVCLRLAGLGRALGSDSVAALAESTARQIAEGTPIAELNASLETLLAVCPAA